MIEPNDWKQFLTLIYNDSNISNYHYDLLFTEIKPLTEIVVYKKENKFDLELREYLIKPYEIIDTYSSTNLEDIFSKIEYWYNQQLNLKYTNKLEYIEKIIKQTLYFKQIHNYKLHIEYENLKCLRLETNNCKVVIYLQHPNNINISTLECYISHKIDVSKTVDIKTRNSDIVISIIELFLK